MTKKRASFFDRLWHLFASVKLSVTLLVLIAVSSIAGTLIPQNQNPEQYRDHFGNALFTLMDTLNVFDMYHSLWFQILILLLAVNLIICSLERFPATLKIARKSMVKKPDRYKKNKGTYSFQMPSLPESAITTIKHQLAKAAGTPMVEKNADGYSLYAEKGRWTRFGVYIVHISVLLLLLGGLAGSIAGFEGQMNIPEGGMNDTVHLKNAHQQVKLNFQIQCDDFDVTFYDTGAPKEYRSQLNIIEDGEVVMSKAIIVNDPLRYKGINIFQSSYGTLPGESVTLAFKSKESGMVYTQEVTFDKEIEVPETNDTFVLSDFMPAFNIQGRVLKNVFVGIYVKENGEKEMVIMPQSLEWFDSMRRQKPPVSLSVTDMEKKYYTGLQITKDPGVWFVYAGFIIMIIGCYITFFMSHRMYCIDIVKEGNAYTVTTAGMAAKNKYGMEMAVTRLGRKLERAFV